MTRHTIIHASDLHLGTAGGPERSDAAAAAWGRFERAVVEAEPDLVVLSGDLVVDDPDDEHDQRHAHELISELAAPVLVVPGNHDVGDHPVRAGLPADWHGKLVTDERVAEWERRWGPSFGLTELGEWSILALNSQVLGTGLRREAEQRRWLEQTALPAIGDRPFLLVTHESLDTRPDTPHDDSWMSVPTESSRDLAALLGGRSLVAVLSGHTHRFLEWHGDGVRNVTAPGLAGPIPVRDDMSQADGDPTPGWLVHTLGSHGRLSVEHHSLTASAH
ncbi:MAG: metallophosphoesterase [Herbiconiux sp.]|nr:metallophosphoesterase [Herbiconiux sp.]